MCMTTVYLNDHDPHMRGTGYKVMVKTRDGLWYPAMGERVYRPKLAKHCLGPGCEGYYVHAADPADVFPVLAWQTARDRPGRRDPIAGKYTPGFHIWMSPNATWPGRREYEFIVRVEWRHLLAVGDDKQGTRPVIVAKYMRVLGEVEDVH